MTDWDDSYRQAEPPPWDIGRPQPIFRALADSGAFGGDLLDAGCGTGEHTLLAAAAGANALGVDLSEQAIERARAKAADRGLSVRFEVGDLLELPLAPASFDTIIDSGVFHVFDDADRSRYVDTLTRLTRPGGRCHLACFSDRQPGDWGPRRVTRAELETAFAAGWVVEAIEPASFEVNPMPEGSEVQAWLLRARRT
jgi:SAM-dependent methyltransferase